MFSTGYRIVRKRGYAFKYRYTAQKVYKVFGLPIFTKEIEFTPTNDETLPDYERIALEKAIKRDISKTKALEHIKSREEIPFTPIEYDAEGSRK